jgi:hypothetical protein
MYDINLIRNKNIFILCTFTYTYESSDIIIEFAHKTPDYRKAVP